MCRPYIRSIKYPSYKSKCVGWTSHNVPCQPICFLFFSLKINTKLLESSDLQFTWIVRGYILYRGTIFGLTEKTPFLYRYFKVLGRKKAAPDYLHKNLQWGFGSKKVESYLVRFLSNFRSSSFSKVGCGWNPAKSSTLCITLVTYILHSD